MADLSVLIPTVTSSYTVLAEEEYDESTYVTTSASVDVLFTDTSASYAVLAEEDYDESVYVRFTPSINYSFITNPASGEGDAAAPQQQVTQVWHFS